MEGEEDGAVGGGGEAHDEGHGPLGMQTTIGIAVGVQAIAMAPVTMIANPVIVSNARFCLKI